MKRKHLLFVGILMASVLCLTAFADTANAQNFRFQYTAKFICGTNNQQVFRVLPGDYTTAINILNFGNTNVNVRARIALTFPANAASPGNVSDFVSFGRLNSGQALEIDCEEIPDEFNVQVGQASYVKGFITIQSTANLDVTAVYTAGSFDNGAAVAPDQNGDGAGVKSIDIERIPGRRIQAQQ